MADREDEDQGRDGPQERSFRADREQRDDRDGRDKSDRAEPLQGRTRQDEADDPHHASYHHWRSTQLSSHDRDYARWRDEDYGAWRNDRHSAFSKEFEGWRAGLGGQSGVPASAQPANSDGSVASSVAVNPSERSAYD